MNEDKAQIYDPNPIDLELELFSNLGGSNLSFTDFAKPEAIPFIINNQKIALAKLKIAEKQISLLQTKVSELTDERENLRIRVARRLERDKVTWLEIPISILSGFSINMLALKITDGIGWIILIISLIMLTFLRGVDILNKFKSNNVEEK